MRSRGFVALLTSQFFGAVNDNILKVVLTYMVIAGGVWDGQLGSGGQGVVGLAFTLPFILLSGYAGYVSDRWSKRTVTILVRATEIPIAILAAIGFITGQLWLAFAALVLLTAQSAFFGPAKYGMIPELVARESLSRANGVINMLTNIAVIVGTVAAGAISDAYYPKPEAPPDGAAMEVVSLGIEGIAMGWLPGIVMVAVAVAGLVSALGLTTLEAQRPTLTFTWNPIASYVSSIRDMSRGPLFLVTLAWGYFYMLAGIALLVLPEYHAVLDVDRSAASALMGILGIAIGLGSAVAGLISGRRIRPQLVPIGALGITVSFVLLGAYSTSFTSVGILIGIAGFFAGWYIIPLQALLQHLAPDDERGRFIGTANAISFTFLSIGSMIFVVVRGLVQEVPHLFHVSAGLMVLGAGAFGLWAFNLRMIGIDLSPPGESAQDAADAAASSASATATESPAPAASPAGAASPSSPASAAAPPSGLSPSDPSPSGPSPSDPAPSPRLPSDPTSSDPSSTDPPPAR